MWVMVECMGRLINKNKTDVQLKKVACVYLQCGDPFTRDGVNGIKKTLNTNTKTKEEMNYMRLSPDTIHEIQKGTTYKR